MIPGPGCTVGADVPPPRALGLERALRKRRGRSLPARPVGRLSRNRGIFCIGLSLPALCHGSCCLLPSVIAGGSDGDHLECRFLMLVSRSLWGPERLCARLRLFARSAQATKGQENEIHLPSSWASSEEKLIGCVRSKTQLGGAQLLKPTGCCVQTVTMRDTSPSLETKSDHQKCHHVPTMSQLCQGCPGAET